LPNHLLKAERRTRLADGVEHDDAVFTVSNSERRTVGRVALASKPFAMSMKAK
jgi:hypothetical protein